MNLAEKTGYKISTKHVVFLYSSRKNRKKIQIDLQMRQNLNQDSKGLLVEIDNMIIKLAWRYKEPKIMSLKKNKRQS